MPVVLAERILEPELLAAWQGLRPFGLVFPAEDPALIVLCLDHEYPEAGDDHVIYLRRAVASFKGDVVNGAVDLAIQKQLGGETTHGLTYPPFDHRCNRHVPLAWRQT